jgi:hypothetical protein
MSYIYGAPSKTINLTSCGRDFLLGILLLEPCILLIYVCCDVVRMCTTSQHAHNIPSTAAQLSISQKALGTLPDDGNVMLKHVGATIHN